MKAIRAFLKFLKRWFWDKPTDPKQDKLKLLDVEDKYICLDYKGQLINLKKTELDAWNALARSDKRAMAMRFRTMVRQGKIRFEEVNGKIICIKNKDYGA